MTLVDLDPGKDHDRVRRTFLGMADYLALERAETDPEAPADEFFFDAPPGADPAKGRRLGLEQDGRLVGLAELSFGYPAPADAYLGLMLLLPEVRGQGLGRTFLAEVESIARSQGAPALYLAVLDANPRGRAFWLREGFTPAAPPREITIGSRTHQAQRLGKPLV